MPKSHLGKVSTEGLPPSSWLVDNQVLKRVAGLVMGDFVQRLRSEAVLSSGGQEGCGPSSTSCIAFLWATTAVTASNNLHCTYENDSRNYLYLIFGKHSQEQLRGCAVLHLQLQGQSTLPRNRTSCPDLTQVPIIRKAGIGLPSNSSCSPLPGINK